MALTAKQLAFLNAFRKTGAVYRAAQLAGVAARNHSRWAANQEYLERFEEAKMEAAKVLEREAIRRAVEGVERPVYQGGKLGGTIREYSDTLLIFLLKGAMPHKYRDRIQTEHVGFGGGPLTVRFLMPEGYQKPTPKTAKSSARKPVPMPSDHK